MPCRFLVLLLALPFPLVATAGPSSGDKSYLIEDPTPIISPYADFRFRYETDWDSSRPDGSLRDDRQRLRVRSRIGLKIEPNDQWLFNIRARTGNSAAQQSPHLTIQDFNGGDRDDFDGILDLYYARYESPFGNLLLGRHAFPFWKQNELFWHDDVTVTGASFQWANEGPLQGTVGAFYLPDGGWGLNGQLLGAQIAYIREVGDWTFTAAEGFYRLHGEPGASKLRNGNGARDYAIFGNQLQLKGRVGGIPVKIGADTYVNLEDYSTDDANPFTAANANENFGYVLSLMTTPGDFLIGYYYAYIETLAVNASYAQDDWIRWGSNGQTDSSDLQGHEVRLGYQITENFNTVARLYLVDAVTSEQDGQRFRIDFNYKF